MKHAYAAIFRIAPVFTVTAIMAAPVFAQEDEEALWELQELRKEAKEVYTAEVEACIKKELPEALELLAAVRKLAESRGATFETQIMAAELPIELAYACEEFRESKRYFPEELPEIRKRHRLEVRSRMLAVRYRESGDDKEKRRYAAELQDTLEESFEMIQEMIEWEAQEGGPDIEYIKRRAVDRKKYRSEIIERRKQELLDDYDPFDWW